MSESENVIGQAAHWYSRLHDSDAWDASYQEFERWVASDASHATAFEQVQLAMRTVEVHRGDRAIIDIRNRALRRHGKRSFPSAVRPWAIAASLFLMVVATAVWRLSMPSVGPVAPTVISTAVGETRSVTLADGTVVGLDARTRVAVSLNDVTRRVDLLEGQARFQVAHEPDRPFQVLIGQRTVVVTGTDFVVDRIADAVTITLLAGHVSLYDRQDGENLSSRPTAHLSPADRVRGGVNGGAWSYSRVSPDDAVAWQKGWMFFEDEPLETAVEQVNRYSKVQVALDDPALGSLRVSGAFQTARPDTFSEAAASMLGLRVERMRNGGILLARKKI